MNVTNNSNQEPKPFNTRICICCGEPMPEAGCPNNPNMCDACSNISYGMAPRIVTFLGLDVLPRE